VLTHDVESIIGLGKVRALAELEMSLGFRSSFNFIPEGEYRVPDDLRAWLTQNGFEVGVHDHRHDGKLYRSRELFRQSAQCINRYLKEWNAVGFRSGFMLHNLDWMHDLDIAYDASTFDTDPFEPQPDGVGTIFPFWVPRPVRTTDDRRRRTEDGLSAVARRAKAEGQRAEDRGQVEADGLSSDNAGYVELPYTLVQDSTLFLLLGETSPAIWIRKAEWIAQKGGMVLANVHPDYLRFTPGDTGFEVRLYREFLLHLRDRYAGAYWHAPAREVAAFVRQGRSSHQPRRSLRVCMVAHSFYEQDGRIMRYAESLAERGDHVEAVALRLRPQLPRRETIENVQLTRVHRRLSGDRAGRLMQLLSVALFTATAGVVLGWRHLRRRYDLVHVHNIPDFLVFSAWLPRLLGARVILDIHDLVPELYGDKFKEPGEHRVIRALRWLERLSCRHADHVIISNDLWRDLLIQRSVSPDKCSVFINHVDPRVFRRRPRGRADERFILLFPGSFQWHQGLDIAIRAIQHVHPQIPRVELHIYGNGPAKRALEQLAKDLHLEERVRIYPPVALRDMPQLLADADLGIVPKRADSFGDQAYSTKIMEFMSQGVPVVISRTRIDSFYFGENEVTFFESGNEHDLAEKILALWQDPARRHRQAANGLEYADRNSWNRKRGHYLGLVDRLTGNEISPPSDESKRSEGGPGNDVEPSRAPADVPVAHSTVSPPP
jgi:glycosyltransferase involved in cell wall biosynthesis